MKKPGLGFEISILKLGKLNIGLFLKCRKLFSPERLYPLSKSHFEKKYPITFSNEENKSYYYKRAIKQYFGVRKYVAYIRKNN